MLSLLLDNLPGLLYRQTLWRTMRRDCYRALSPRLNRRPIGHAEVRTTMLSTHTLQSRTVKEAKSPLDC